MIDRRERFRQLADHTPVIAPSMLKCDFGRLRDEFQRLEAAGARVLHWDVMDGQFVPNLSYGALLIERLRGQTELLFDAHLMISEPGRYLDDYVKAGCDCITIHAEVPESRRELLDRIRQAGSAAGIAVNPQTPVSAVAGELAYADLLLVMSVEPGFGGQKFMPTVLDKVRHFHQMMKPGTLLAIDGGIGPSTITDAAQAGAGYFVAGSSIFDEADHSAALEKMGQMAATRRLSPPLE